MVRADAAELRYFPATPRLDVRAAGVEAASHRRFGGRWNLASEHLSRTLSVGARQRGEQGLRIAMSRISKEVLSGPDLRDLAEIHHRDAVAEMADHAQKEASPASFARIPQ